MASRVLIVAVLAAVVAGSALRSWNNGTVVDYGDSTTTGSDSSCGGNCPSGDCSGGCPCGTSPNPVDIAGWCSQFSGWDQGCCQCIVNAESSGNANAMNENSNGSYDVGVAQVNSVNWASCSGGSAPCDPGTNLQCAIKVWQWGGNSFNLWSTCGGCGCC